jgi:hypothetical protein
MDEAQKTIIDFVEGRMSSGDFEQRVHNDTALETLLKDPTLKWHDTYIKSNPYDFVIAIDFNDPGGILDAQGAMELFLQRKGVTCQPTKVYSDFHGLLLDAQPKWLDVDSRYLKNQIFPQAGDLKGKKLREWLKTRLIELFRYHKKPPKWIQSPAWPINENGPMYFLGQIKIENCELFHDDGAAYIFLDVKSGETKTIIQLF